MNRNVLARIASLALFCALVCWAAPAFAAPWTPTDLVPSHAVWGTQDLSGWTAADAASFITTNTTTLRRLQTIKVNGKGRSFYFNPNLAASFDVTATLQQAFDATDTTTPFTLAPRFSSPNTTVIGGWVNKIAAGVHATTKNAFRTLDKTHKVMVFHSEVRGYVVNKTVMRARLLGVVRSEVASVTPKPRTQAIQLTYKAKPRITRYNIPKFILIVQSQFKIKLYKGAGLEKQYSCATGMPAYPTPVGKFYVGKKAVNPTWVNPYSSWSMGMPASISGANGPLGSRALYVYDSHGNDTGVRMHGVPPSENWSIGHRASHGCLRMHRWDVENLYPRVKVGTTVWIIK
jgi:lipoprotein-anchoring transpeptidase ErfK/SrfK